MVATDRYSIRVFSDDQDGGYVAVCPEFPGVSAFGESRAEALEEIGTALELAIETYQEQGWPLPEAMGLSSQDLPSGEFRVRMPRSMHAQLSKRASFERVSQNQLLISYVAAGLAGQLWNTGAEIRLRKLEAFVHLSRPGQELVGAIDITTAARHHRDDFSDALDWSTVAPINRGRHVGSSTHRIGRSVN